LKVPLLIAIALMAVTLAVYFQVGNHQFLNLDDNSYVTDNSHVASGLSGANIRWAFTSVEASNWHPLTWLSHMADVQLYGMNPRGHHLTSVAIHTAAALCLFLLLVRITGDLWPSAFVAALFALHPLHVESVAWVAERKDVLSALFCFLTLLAYVEYVARRKLWLYMLTLCLFALGLMSKPMLVTLPLIMLMLDYWPLGRREAERQEPRGLRLITEKIPFFACSVLSGLITIYAQQHGGAMAALTVIPLRLRSENALVAYVTYIGKTIWPGNLAAYYPFPVAIPLWQAAGSLAILLLVTMAVVRAGRRRFLLVGWLWFLVTLLPVIGLIHVGAQAMADRYTYIPAIGLFIMAAWGAPELLHGLAPQQRRGILAALGCAVIIAAATLTWQQLGYWRDNITLYRHTLAVTSGNNLIHNNLGIALQEAGKLDEAIPEFREAIRINPDHMPTHYNLAITYQAKGDFKAAIREYLAALRLNPAFADTHNNLGIALALNGDVELAIKEFREALRLNPADTRARDNLEFNLARRRMEGVSSK
jgi:tetratricopeptide (TPR) repeat protein